MTDGPVSAAEFEVGRARAKMIATSQEIMQQLQPHKLMEEAWDTAKEKGANLAENAVDAVSRRPVATGAVVAGIIAFLTRDSLMSVAGKLVNGAKARSKKGRTAQKKQPAQKVQTEAVE